MGAATPPVTRRKRAMSAVPPESPRASADPSEHTIEHSGAESQAGHPGTDFGPNEWLDDELYQRYLADPSSVAMEWWNFFADYHPPAGSPVPPASAARPQPVAATGPATPEPAAPAPATAGAAPGSPVPQPAAPAAAADGGPAPAGGAQPAAAQAGAVRAGSAQPAAAQAGAAQAGSAQPAAAQAGAAQAGAAEAGGAQAGAA